MPVMVGVLRADDAVRSANAVRAVIVSITAAAISTPR
jgi:hypothetical protein